MPLRTEGDLQKETKDTKENRRALAENEHENELARSAGWQSFLPFQL